MKFFTKTLHYILFLGLVLILQSNINAQIGITYSFANGQVTGTAPNEFYEFDIMAVASATGSHFQLGQVYIDYNTNAFGSSISGTANLTIIKGALLSKVTGANGDEGKYQTSSANNTASKLAIQNTWVWDDDNDNSIQDDTDFDLTNALGTTPQVYAHVKMAIENTTETSGLSFDGTINQIELQQRYFDATSTQIIYDPVAFGVPLDQPLPVELSSFSATNQKGNAVNLQWETATEVNNYGFEVERSIVTETADEKPETGMEWEKISFVEGAGNSNSSKSYSFTDKNPVGGTKFSYRLKQVDIDGTFEYSDLVEVEVLPTEYELYQNYPNPFNPSTKIKFSLPEDAKVAVDIYNMLGQRVMTLFNKNMKAGYHQVLFDTQSAGNQLASGVYIYTISTKNFSSVKKMVLLK